MSNCLHRPAAEVAVPRNCRDLLNPFHLSLFSPKQLQNFAQTKEPLKPQSYPTCSNRRLFSKHRQELQPHRRITYTFIRTHRSPPSFDTIHGLTQVFRNHSKISELCQVLGLASFTLFIIFIVHLYVNVLQREISRVATPQQSPSNSPISFVSPVPHPESYASPRGSRKKRLCGWLFTR